MRFNKNKVKKILIIKPSAIGDVLLSTPVIENLRKNFPDAFIVFLTQMYCRDMVTGNPFLDRVLTYDLSVDNSLCLLKNIRKQKYDLVLDLFGNPRTALITLWSDAPYRVGYKFNYRSLAYNIRIKPRSKNVHNIEFNLDALRALNLDITTSKPFLYIDSINDEFADRFFNENQLTDKPVIAINPNGTWETKTWYAEYFKELIGMLGNKYHILIVWGSNEEKKYSEKLLNGFDNVKLIPETGLKGLGALLKKCKLFITNDTGPMHIAWVLGVKTAAIFGPTNYIQHGPVYEDSMILFNEELDCLGCDLTVIAKCPNEHKCMKELKPSKIFKKIENLI